MSFIVPSLPFVSHKVMETATKKNFLEKTDSYLSRAKRLLM